MLVHRAGCGGGGLLQTAQHSLLHQDLTSLHTIFSSDSKTPNGFAVMQAMALRRNMPPVKVPIEGLQLGPLLGKGSFGRVYRGRFHDRPVAVKVGQDVSQRG